MLFVFHLFYKIAISYSAKCVTEASDNVIYSSLWDLWCWQCNSRYEKKQQEGMFSWTKRLVRQVVQRILDTVLWPSPVTAHWEASRQNLFQTWKRTFSAPWNKMVMKCPPSKSWSSFWAERGPANWILTLSIYIYGDYIMATATDDFLQPWKEFRVKIKNEAFCALGKTDKTGLKIVRSFQEILWVPIPASSHTWRNTDIINGAICFGY